MPRVNRAAYRVLDSVMLKVMQRNPTCLKPTFEAMFARNPGPRIFRFLDERATFGEVLSLILTLPKRPFVLGAAQLAYSRSRARLTGQSTSRPARPASQSLDAGTLPPRP